ncbi:unnamed protein product, partial [marine sediment metagenome]
MHIVQSEKSNRTAIQSVSLNWINNPSVQKLLDV